MVVSSFLVALSETRDFFQLGTNGMGYAFYFLWWASLFAFEPWVTSDLWQGKALSVVLCKRCCGCQFYISQLYCAPSHWCRNPIYS
mmetsp:Transcript_121951/g.182097  ORF Transcript_121951/g.182097 Transcript_121951/m.182097 type:complete len:86 (+) Transcript_121951:998-1255(+)